MEDFGEFSPKKWQRIQALSLKLEALNSLLDFFSSNEICDRQLVNDCKSITDSLKADLKNTIEALVQLIEVEDEIEE